MNYDEITALVHNTKTIIFDEKMAHTVTVKGAADYVTKVDVAVQEYMREKLANNGSFYSNCKKYEVIFTQFLKQF